MDKYEGMTAYICDSGHIKYCRKNNCPVICNVCGSRVFTYATEKQIENDKRSVQLTGRAVG